MHSGLKVTPAVLPLDGRRFRVGVWTVDPQVNEISLDGRDVTLEPKVVAVLVYLAERSGQTVSRDELLEAIWGGVAVVDEALTRCVSQLRRALGDDRQEPQYIQTVAKRGYRLLATVTVDDPVYVHPHSASVPPVVDSTVASQVNAAADATAPAVVPPSQPAVTVRTIRNRWWAAAPGLLAAAAVFVLTQRSNDSSPTVARFTLALGSGERLAAPPALAISRDGRRVAYVVELGGKTNLYLRRIDEIEARAVVGSDGADQPFFSHDGQWVAFFASGRLKKARVTGGASLLVSEAPTNVRGGTWLPDDTIVLGTSNTGLFKVPASGGDRTPLTTLQGTEGSHRWPHVLPDGQTLLFGVGPAITSTDWSEAHIVAQSLSTGVRRTVVTRGTYPRFLPGNTIVYVENNALYSIDFDPSTMEARGPSAPLSEIVTAGGLNGGAADIGISDNGSLALVRGSVFQPTSLGWVDRQGRFEPIPHIQPSSIGRVSPDGTRIALTSAGPDPDIWVYDVARRISMRMTEGGTNQWPVWTPDGQRIAYASTRTGSAQIFWAPADGNGPEEQLTKTSFAHAPRAWSVNGPTLFFDEPSPFDGTRIWRLPLDTRVPERLSSANVREFQEALSPDGRWLAYTSDSSGRREVYVRALSGNEPRWQVSLEGGQEPLWHPNGRELFFRREDDMMGVEVRLKPPFVASNPRRLFTGRFVRGPWITAYDVTSDGRFLMAPRPAEPVQPQQVTVVLNWVATLAGSNRDR